MEQKGRGDLAVLWMWGGEPFCRWNGSSLHVCYLALLAGKTMGSHFTHNALGQDPRVLVSGPAPGSEQNTSQSLSYHHGGCSAFLLTSMTRLWNGRLESEDCLCLRRLSQRSPASLVGTCDGHRAHLAFAHLGCKHSRLH